MNKYLEKLYEENPGGGMSRRGFITAAGLATVGGILASGSMAAVAGPKEAAHGTPPALPWQWVKLDPLEAGKRTFKLYHEKGG